MATLLLTCRDRDSVDRHYIPAVLQGGWDGEIQVLRPGEPLPPMDAFAGLLLTGGADIHPRIWEPTEPLHPRAQADEERDNLELPLAKAAWDLGLPILGICRGEQLLNVALGGSLIQDIPSHFGCPPERHRQGSSDDPILCHRVDVAPASRLANLLGTANLPVNSRHHQAAHRIAPGLKAVAWHPETVKDGTSLVEGLEAVDPARWAVGVQWHPENLVRLDNEAGVAARKLFASFVLAVQAFRKS